MLSHQIQHNAPVDVPRRFAAGDLEMVQINFTHNG
jgi:hypothetical protein